MAMARRGRPRKPRLLSDYSDVMTVAEARDFLRLRAQTVYELIYSGRLRAIRFGRTIRVPKVAVEEFLASEGRGETALAGGR
jgi:DNA binding domain, excisionase family